MRIDVADASAVEPEVIYEAQDLIVTCDVGSGQILQIGENGFTLAQNSQSKLADNEGMGENHPAIQQFRQFRVAVPQMVYPDRRVDQDHLRVDRRRGTFRSAFSLPPSLASRRALSRSIRAFNASRTNADFSVIPVNA
jgi:hypothetical protein